MAQQNPNRAPSTAEALALAVSAERRLAEARRELEALGVYMASLIGRLGTIIEGGRS